MLSAFRKFSLIGFYAWMLFLTGGAFAKNGIPVVYQPLSPTSAAPGSAGFTLAVRGSGFVNGAVVRWNGASLSTTYINRGTLHAVVSADKLINPGTAAITVSNPAPGGGVSNASYFQVHGSATSIGTALNTSFVPPALSYETVADLNCDTIPDIAISDLNKGIDVYLGNGDGTFQNPLKISTGLYFSQVLASDLNGDGKMDLVASRPFLCTGCGGWPTWMIYTFMGDCTGHFFKGPEQGRNTGQVLALADVNGDGALDLFTVSTDYDGIDWDFHVILGNGDGTFKRQSQKFVAGAYSSSIPAIADFNRDGKLDLAMVGLDYQYGFPLLYVCLGNGDGSFQPAMTSYVLPWDGGHQAITADVNGDGVLDLVTDSVAVLLGNGDGTFTNDVNVNVRGAYLPNYGLVVGDLNADGALDFASKQFLDTAELLVALGNSGGTYTTLYVPGNSQLFGAADFNGDGLLDFLTATGIYESVAQ